MSDVINESQILFKQEHPFKFREDNFANAVVSPMYRKTERPHRMYVVKIRHDLNPLSEFPQSNLYETYSDYYRIKYGADISNLKQPLLEVEYTNLRLNLLTSRVHKSKQEKSMSSRVKEVVENDADKQFFVPELCYIWPIAAPLWKKTGLFPKHSRGSFDGKRKVTRSDRNISQIQKLSRYGCFLAFSKCSALIWFVTQIIEVFSIQHHEIIIVFRNHGMLTFKTGKTDRTIADYTCANKCYITGFCELFSDPFTTRICSQILIKEKGVS